MRLAAAVLVALVAGCLSGGPGQALQDPVQARPGEFLCQHARYTPADACASTLGEDGDTWAEPYVLAHPSRQGVFLVAVQGLPAPFLPSTVIPRPSGLGLVPCDDWGTCLFVTQDGGASWTRMAVGDDDLLADPIMAFVGDRLFVAALAYDPVLDSQQTGGIKGYWSDDLGTTWTSVALVERAGTDRPWMATHEDEIMVVWQTSGEKEGWWSRSTDRGASWQEIRSHACNIWSRPYWSGGWHAACAGQEGTEIVDLDTGQVVGRLAGGSGTRHASLGVEGPWIGVPGPARAFLLDTGSRPVVQSRIDSMPGAPFAQDWIYWMEAAPWGGLLALVAGGDASALSDAGDDYPVYLVQLDGAGRTLAVHAVSSGERAAPDRPVRAADDHTDGEFHGIGCRPESCLIAWMDDGLVDVAWLGPPHSNT